ncbi:hypothetical protein ABH940_002284 [Streptacidiphilus sp. BW17]
MSAGPRRDQEPRTIVPRPPYPPVGEFTLPELGEERTWEAPAQSFFGECHAAADTVQKHVCPVGVYRIRDYVTGCDCACHDERRIVLRGGQPKRGRS